MELFDDDSLASALGNRATSYRVCAILPNFKAKTLSQSPSFPVPERPAAPKPSNDTQQDSLMTHTSKVTTNIQGIKYNCEMELWV
jgi:hypothetical protein